MANINSIITIVLRLIVLTTTFVAAIVMGTAHDSAQVLNLTFEAKYTNSPTFKYFVIAYAIVSCYSFAVLLLPYKRLLWRFILILDAMMTLLLASSISAAIAIADVGKNGNSHAGWLPICNQVPKFCRETTAALVLGFVAAIIQFLLLIHSLHSSVSPLFPVKG